MRVGAIVMVDLWVEEMGDGKRAGRDVGLRYGVFPDLGAVIRHPWEPHHVAAGFITGRHCALATELPATPLRCFTASLLR